MATTPDSSSHPLLSSMGDFLLLGIRPKTPLARAIVLVLVFKLVVVVSMQVFFLCGAAQTDAGASTIRHVLGPVNH